MTSGQIKQFLSQNVVSSVDPKDWGRGQKFKFSTFTEFENKHHDAFDPADLIHADCIHGNMIQDGTQYIYRNFCAVENADGVDYMVHVFTDSTDTNVVFCSGNGD